MVLDDDALKRVLNTPLSTPILGLLEYSKKVGHDCDGNRVCAAWPEETGVTSQFIKSHYIPVKGGFNFSGIPIALTYYIPVHILCIFSREKRQSLFEMFTRTELLHDIEHDPRFST